MALIPFPRSLSILCVKSKGLLAIFVSICLLVIQASVARPVPLGGGIDGGAGCGVPLADGSWVLKDYLRVHPQGNFLGYQTSGEKLSAAAEKISLMVGSRGFSDIRETKAYRNAHAKIETWIKYEPILAPLALEALEAIYFYGTDQWLPTGSGYACDQEGEHPIVIYLPSPSKEMVALLSVPLWNSLPQVSQEGVLLKEAWRVLQNLWGEEFLQEEGFSEKSELLISKIVYNLVFAQPRYGLLTSLLREGLSQEQLASNFSLNEHPRAQIASLGCQSIMTDFLNKFPKDLHCDPLFLSNLIERKVDSEVANWLTKISEYLAEQTNLPETARLNLEATYRRVQDLRGQILEVDAFRVKSAANRPRTIRMVQALKKIAQQINNCGSSFPSSCQMAEVLDFSTLMNTLKQRESLEEPDHQ